MKMTFLAVAAIGLNLAGTPSARAQTNNSPATAPLPLVTTLETNAPAPATKSTKAKAAPKKKPASKAAVKTPAKTPAAVPGALPADKPEGRTPITPPENALVKQDYVNVRGQAGLIGEVITRLRKGEPVVLLEDIHLKKSKPDEPAHWFKIVMPTNTPVWVTAEFVDETNHVVSAKKLNVRAGPGENYSVVARLEKGAAIKEIRKVNNWIEIETPTEAYAYIGAEFVARQASPTITATPPPPTEVVSLPTAEKPVPANPNPVTNPVAETPPSRAVEVPAPMIGSPRPAPAMEVPSKRIVKREGIVRRAASIQSPTYFLLENPETGKAMNYIHNEKHPEYQMKLYKGFRIIVTGEELIDSRWPDTPVIEIETLDLP